MSESEILLESLPEIYDSLIMDLEKTEGGPEISLKMLPTLSHKIYGLTRGRMYVIGGRTSQGKTTLALQLAMDVARQGFKVYFLSLEMDQKEIMLRMLSNILEKDANDIRYHLSKYKKSADAVKEFFIKSNFPMLLAYNVGVTMNELNDLISDLPAPDLVIVDYIQAIRKLDQDKLTTLNNYIIDFRSLCVKNNFCGIMVSQINREAMGEKDKRPNMWQLKGSGTIEEHADMVLLCHWDFFYSESPTADRRKYRVTVAKNRQGETGFTDLDFYPEFYKFKEAGAIAYPDTRVARVKETFEAKEVQ
jgi:replicative DNA helicase